MKDFKDATITVWYLTPTDVLVSKVRAAVCRESAPEPIRLVADFPSTKVMADSFGRDFLSTKVMFKWIPIINISVDASHPNMLVLGLAQQVALTSWI